MPKADRSQRPVEPTPWGHFTLRTLVTPGSVFLPSKTCTGEGMPQRTIASSRPSGVLRTIGAR